MSLAARDPGDDVETMDREHEAQLVLMEALKDVLASEPAGPRTCQIFDQLLDYLKVHFGSEQLLMRMHGYPGVDQHVREHERMLEHLASLRSRIQDGETGAVPAVLDLQREIERHVHERDEELRHFLLQPPEETPDSRQQS